MPLNKDLKKDDEFILNHQEAESIITGDFFGGLKAAHLRNPQ
jgi:hypothetical protein